MFNLLLCVLRRKETPQEKAESSANTEETPQEDLTGMHGEDDDDDDDNATTSAEARGAKRGAGAAAPAPPPKKVRKVVLRARMCALLAYNSDPSPATPAQTPRIDSAFWLFFRTCRRRSPHAARRQARRASPRAAMRQATSGSRHANRCARQRRPVCLAPRLLFRRASRQRLLPQAALLQATRATRCECLQLCLWQLRELATSVGLLPQIGLA